MINNRGTHLNAGGNNNAKIVENEGLVLSSATDWAETNFITKHYQIKSLVVWATIKDNDGSRGGAPIAISRSNTTFRCYRMGRT